jgi:hypothetical protein
MFRRQFASGSKSDKILREPAWQRKEGKSWQRKEGSLLPEA